MLGHHVASKAEVDAVMGQILRAGPTITDPRTTHFGVDTPVRSKTPMGISKR
jgi:hypothetical protein